MQVYPLSDAALLALWEAGHASAPLERAVVILESVCPEASGDELLAMRIGERNRWLLLARAATFGSRLQGLADCAVCRETVEFTLDAVELAEANRPAASHTLAVSREGYSVSFRLPATQDLAVVAHSSFDPARELLARCVLSADRDGTPCTVAELPEQVIALVEEEMARADPNADLQLALTCPACGHQWTMVLDITSFMWREIHSRALSILRDVHALATAYGWSERDILDMDPARRAMYLELVSA